MAKRIKLSNELRKCTGAVDRRQLLSSKFGIPLEEILEAAPLNFDSMSQEQRLHSFINVIELIIKSSDRDII